MGIVIKIMKNKILLSMLIATSSSLVYSNSEISTNLLYALQCKNFDKENQDLSKAAYAGNLKELNQYEQGTKEKYPLSREFLTKFKLKKSNIGGYGGYAFEYKSPLSVPFEKVILTVTEGFGAELFTERLGNINIMVEDFINYNKKIKIHHINQQQLIVKLREINGKYQLSNEEQSLLSLKESIKKIKNGKEYYSNDIYFLKSINPDLEYTNTTLYSDPLNSNLIHTMCNLEI